MRRVYIRICDGLSRSLWSQPGSQPDCYKTVLIRNSKYALVYILDVWYVFESCVSAISTVILRFTSCTGTRTGTGRCTGKKAGGPNVLLHGAPKIEFHGRFLGARGAGALAPRRKSSQNPGFPSLCI